MSFLEDIKNSIIGACMLASFVTMFIVTCFDELSDTRDYYDIDKRIEEHAQELKEGRG